MPDARLSWNLMEADKKILTCDFPSNGRIDQKWYDEADDSELATTETYTLEKKNYLQVSTRPI